MSKLVVDRGLRDGFRIKTDPERLADLLTGRSGTGRSTEIQETITVPDSLVSETRQCQGRLNLALAQFP